MSAMSCVKDEIIYDSEQDVNIGLSSEKVQALANSVYAEFKRMMGFYGEDSIKQLMPLIVTILESLDQSLTQCKENVVELEMLREDNDQLASRFEQERQLRKHAEKHLMENEDHTEGITREFKSKVDKLEGNNKQLEMRCKNYADQIERLHDRESEAKDELTLLRERHNEMIQSYMEHIEKTKFQKTSTVFSESPSSPTPSKLKKEVLVRTGSSPPTSITTYPSTEDQSIHYNSPLENSLLLEGVSEIGSTPTDPNGSSLQEEMPKSPTKTKMNLIEVNTLSPSVDVLQQTSEIASSENLSKMQSSLTDVTDMKEESEKLAEESCSQVQVDESSGEKAAIIKQSSAEVTVDEDFAVNNESSLFAELSFQDLGDVDKGADIAGMSKEVENLLHENTKLLATKNALNVVKDDLIQKVDQLTTYNTLLKDELANSEKSKVELEQRLTETEKEILKMQEEMKDISARNVKSPPQSTANKSTRNPEEEEVLPMAQRKRFTRVEMARVLMERNQYKERLMELQEAVRWTETLRAARSLNENSDQPKAKQKSSIFHFFHRLFQSSNNESSTPLHSANERAPSFNSQVTSSNSARRFTPNDQGSFSMQYNAGSSKIIPRSKSTTHFYGRSPTIDSLRAGDDNEICKETKNKKDKQTSVKLLDSGRLQACGWSLPNTPTSPPKEIENTRRTTVPVPVYCGPVFDTEPCMKLWCASSVDNFDGLVDSPEAVKSSTTDTQKFLKDSSDSNKDELSDVDKLDQELLLQQKELKLKTNSLVWLVASDTRCKNGTLGGSKILVKDACRPGSDVETFDVGSHDTHILCICSVPAVQNEDSTDDTTTFETDYHTEAGITSPSDDVTTTIGKVEKVTTPPETEFKDCEEEAIKKKKNNSQISGNESQKLESQTTMWLGAQSGHVYLHSAVTNWSKCLHKIRLRDTVLGIVHNRGRVLVALADGTVAIFCRRAGGCWDLSCYYLLDLGKPHHSVRCMSVVYEKIWCGYRNRVHVVDPISIKVETSFDAHPRRESQVRQMVWAGDGVWISIRLDSTIRLYHARTYQHLQDVDVEPYVSKVLGSGKLGFSFVRITSLAVSSYRLWIGTGNGVVMSVPLSEGYKSSGGATFLSSSTFGLASASSSGHPGGAMRVYTDANSQKDQITSGTFIPYCSMANAQLSFHGYREAVKFFVTIPGCVTHSTEKNFSSNISSSISCSSLKSPPKDSVLVLSGGDGYVDFRRGDLAAISPPDDRKTQRSQHGMSSHLSSYSHPSHMIVWQLTQS